MIREIFRYGQTVVHTRAARVEKIRTETQTLIDDIIETMYAANGIGLAAPQIGVSLRAFVVDLSSGRNAEDLIILINPEVILQDGTQKEEEGCLSIPGFESKIDRPKKIILKGLDRHGQKHEVEGIGLLARALQHELDHLNGSLFLDRLSGIKRELILRKIKKLKRKEEW